jgi:hypothetical protein
MEDKSYVWKTLHRPNSTDSVHACIANAIISSLENSIMDLAEGGHTAYFFLFACQTNIRSMDSTIFFRLTNYANAKKGEGPNCMHRVPTTESKGERSLRTRFCDSDAIITCSSAHRTSLNQRVSVAR